MIVGRTVCKSLLYKQGSTETKICKNRWLLTTEIITFSHMDISKSAMSSAFHTTKPNLAIMHLQVSSARMETCILPWYLASRLATIHMEVITLFMYSTELWSQISCRKSHWSPYLQATKYFNWQMRQIMYPTCLLNQMTNFQPYTKENHLQPRTFHKAKNWFLSIIKTSFSDNTTANL